MPRKPRKIEQQAWCMCCGQAYATTRAHSRTCSDKCRVNLWRRTRARVLRRLTPAQRAAWNYSVKAAAAAEAAGANHCSENKPDEVAFKRNK